MGKGRFGVLLCAEDSDYVRKRYGGIFGVFLGMLTEEGETWDVFRVFSGELPEDDDLADYDGFVITGSCRDAHGNDPCISDLCFLLKRLHALRKRVLGVCFGHQVLCRALGGKTGRAAGGWDIGVTSVKILPSASLPAHGIPSSISVIECHRDEILELPPAAEVLAWSDKTKVEMFKLGDHILGIQGHPEYNKDILLHLIDRLLHRNLIDVSHADKVKEKLDKDEPHREAWKRLCRSFLKGGL
ncbi:gamma-glutamyl peptidase 5-like [Nymphaea colorata]|nr:gamma-glutamyl peptidase 5-like [Nymphaea colorata]